MREIWRAAVVLVCLLGLAGCDSFVKPYDVRLAGYLRGLNDGWFVLRDEWKQPHQLRDFTHGEIPATSMSEYALADYRVYVRKEAADDAPEDTVTVVAQPLVEGRELHTCVLGGWVYYGDRARDVLPSDFPAAFCLVGP